MENRFLFRFRALFLGGALLLGAAAVQADPIETIAAKLAKGAKQLPSRKVAVLPFTYPEGWISTGSTLIAEELTTALVGRKKITVIERSQLTKLLSEAKLEYGGITESGAAQKVGKVLGADAIVTGTLVDIADRMTTVNARLIKVETGEVLAAAEEDIDRTWTDDPHSVAAETSLASSDKGREQIVGGDGQTREMSPLIPVHYGPYRPEYPAAAAAGGPGPRRPPPPRPPRN